MLLRSTSTPIVNSWTQQYTKDTSSPELDPAFQLPRARSISLASSSNFHPHSDDPAKKMTQVLSETNSKKSERKKNPVSNDRKSKITVQDSEEEMKPTSGSSIQRLFSTSGLGDSTDEDESGALPNDDKIQTQLMGGAAGNNGGKICGGCGWKGSNGGGGGGQGGGSGSFEHGRDSTDVYYRKMIEANPGNALLLGNYAKYLKEVKRNMAKAEEYCGRAILANPTDGGVLSLYADLIWEMHKDASRAEAYHEQAVKSAPDDCYVLASYARFLWDAEEEDEGDEEGRRDSNDLHHHHHSSPPICIWEPHRSPITAAS